MKSLEYSDSGDRSFVIIGVITLEGRISFVVVNGDNADYLDSTVLRVQCLSISLTRRVPFVVVD